MTRGFAHVLVLIILVVGVLAIYVASRKEVNTPIDTFAVTPAPTPYQFPYKAPVIAKNRSYRIVIVGDSIVATLGANANSLRLNLINYYPESEFVTYNYGYPATNVLSLPERLVSPTKNAAADNPAILSQGFELIIIESFAFNPLSHLALPEGLKKQAEVLEESVRLVLREKPDVAIAFMTPIAPHPTRFATGTYSLSDEERKIWVAERLAYIENHKKFATERSIPVIDVYAASLGPDGVVDSALIADDTIHPSEEGIELISRTIADYIFLNNIFPK